MESALMMAPPSSPASLSASADLPLAVGPAMRMALGLLTGRDVEHGGPLNQLRESSRVDCTPNQSRGYGYPQCGQKRASLLISLPQMQHVVSVGPLGSGGGEENKPTTPARQFIAAITN